VTAGPPLEQAIEQATLVADAVLYEGYLLYPYRASSEKNQLRWQFGILGPPQADPGAAEPAELSAQSLLLAPMQASLSLRLRFLQLQSRDVQRADNADRFESVAQLQAGGETWLSWDEAMPHDLALGPMTVTELLEQPSLTVQLPGGEDVEVLFDATGAKVGRIVRRRQTLAGRLSIGLSAVGGDGMVGSERLYRLSVAVTNSSAEPAADRDEALARSFIGAHLLLVTAAGRFLSLLEPPEHARAAAEACRQSRCWPVLASEQDDVLLVSPIILYDHPAVAPQSAGALFDATEIDEILTLRVMTMTETEKAEARATDPRAAAIIDRCDAMSPEALQLLHGVLRDPHLATEVASAGLAATGPASLDPASLGPASTGRQVDEFDVPTWADTGGSPWWDPTVDASVSPGSDAVWVAGVRIARGSRVRLRPSRRADAQDLFFAGQEATVTAVFADVDGNFHVAVVLVDDPAADLHEWYGRYLYFAPDELQPLPEAPDRQRREEV